MQIGTRVRYGMLAMMDLARRGSAVPARALDIAQAHGLSKGYLEGLLAALRRAGLVRAIRGPGGGWVLARPAGRIRPLEVFTALEGGTRLVPCAEDIRICPGSVKRCRARSLWVAMGKALDKVLRAETLASLSGAARKRKAPPRRRLETKSKVKTRSGAKAKARGKAKTDRKAKAHRKAKEAPAGKAAKRGKAAGRGRAVRSKIVRAPARKRLRKSA